MADVPPKRPTGPDKSFAFLAPPEGPDEIGRLGAYRVLKLLGRGGMGMVFKAEDPQLQRAVALKVMLPTIAANEAARERFLREARAAAKLEHDNIIAIYQVGDDRGVPYIAMPFLKGMSLEDWLKRNPPLKMPQILRIGREIARGLQAAHDRGLVHRDIKPANLWLDAATNGRIKILDFGLARPEKEDAGLTRSGQILGTPSYMSPEQAEGKKIDGRSDLFSLGVVLYRLCTGVLPFRGPNIMAVLMALATQDPPPAVSLNPEMPPALSDLIARLMRKDPAARPASAKEVVDSIATIERERAMLARTGLNVTPQTVAVDSVRAAASRTFNFDDSDSYLSDEDFEAAKNGKEAMKAESRRPNWFWPAIYGATAVGVLAIVGVVGLMAMPQSAAPPVELVRAKPVADPPVVPDPPKKVDPPPVTKKTDNPPAPIIPVAGERPLFNGKDLTGWNCNPKVWHVENGEIVASIPPQSGIDGGLLVAPGKFGDFELTFEVRTTGRATAHQHCHLYLRCVDAKTPFPILGIEDPGWIHDGKNFSFAALQGPSPAMNKAIRKNDYNQMTVRVVGDKLTLVVNGVAGEPIDYSMAREGQLKWNFSKLTDELRIRNIRLVDLSVPTPSVPQPRPLFNGKDLVGWKREPANWKAENGEIVGNSEKLQGSHELVAPGQYGDFELTFEAKTTFSNKFDGSHFFLRVEPPNSLLDKTKSSTFAIGLQGFGNVYAVDDGWHFPVLKWPSAAATKAFKKSDYNTYKVQFVGKKMTLSVNGIASAEVDAPMPGDVRLSWHLGRDSPDVHLRNIQITELRPPLFGEWESLMTGRTFDKWWVTKGEPDGVTVYEEGEARIRFRAVKAKDNYISTRKNYRSHHMRLDFQLIAGTKPPRFSIGPSTGSDFGCLLNLSSQESPSINFWWGLALEGTFRNGAIVRKKDGPFVGIRFAGEAPLKIGDWNRLELVRLNDGIVYVLNDRLVGAIAELRHGTAEKQSEVGSTAETLFVNSGDVNVRRVQIREISALPPEILKLVQ
jgi:serine/threonine protein kinase